MKSLSFDEGAPMIHLSNSWMVTLRHKLFSAVICFTFMGCGSVSKDPACKISQSGISTDLIKGTSLSEQEIVFTFERSPSSVTDDVSVFLESRSIRSTFFVEESRLLSHDLMSSLREKGHLIGNGTLSNANLKETPELLTEIRHLDEIITPYIVGNIFLFRAPNDFFSEQTAEYLNRQGLQKYVGPIGADVLKDASHSQAIDKTCSADNISPTACAKRYFDAITEQKKGIIRFTDGSNNLPLLLRELVAALETAKFKFLRLDQVPEVRKELIKREARVDSVSGDGGCSDY